jgi:hypothetical protein
VLGAHRTAHLTASPLEPETETGTRLAVQPEPPKAPPRPVDPPTTYVGRATVHGAARKARPVKPANPTPARLSRPADQ